MKKMMLENNIQNKLQNNTLFNKIRIQTNKILFIILICIFITLFKVNNSFSNSSIYKYFDSMENPNILLAVNPNWSYSSFWGTIARDVVFYDPEYNITSSFAIGIPTKPKNAIKTGVSFYDNINEKSTHKIFPIYVSQWIYSPKLGRYYKLAGFGFTYNTDEDMIGFDYSFFIDNDYTKSRKNLKESPFNMAYFDGSLIGDSFVRNRFYEFRWFAMIGSNCYFDARRKEQKVKCYNELDTSDYERYMIINYTNKSISDKIIDNSPGPLSVVSYLVTAPFNKKGETLEIKVESENSELYEKFYNLEVYSGLKLIKEKSDNKKVLIMINKWQAEVFYNYIKKLPDNYISNIKGGYVWFMSEDIPNNNTGYKINYKKYDTKPNNKYDAELSRISGGKLKAKYGRYLTKERYSEDYVAPSIYGNNYNDMPEW